MKANRKFLNNEEAVSPVIAVILMVAITVVLAATVFVLVNDLGKNVGTTGPSLGMVSDSAQSSTSQWTIKLSSATKLADLTDYRFVFASPDNGTMVYTPAVTTFTGNGLAGCIERPAADQGQANTWTATDTATGDGNYCIRLLDVDGNGKWSVGDTITLTYTSGDALALTAGQPTRQSTFPDGEYTLEILHIPSGTSAASLPRTF